VFARMSEEKYIREGGIPAKRAALSSTAEAIGGSPSL
jgi:hypothetical protein